MHSSATWTASLAWTRARDKEPSPAHMVARQRRAVTCLGAIAITASRRDNDFRADELVSNVTGGTLVLNLLQPGRASPCSAIVFKVYRVNGKQAEGGERSNRRKFQSFEHAVNGAKECIRVARTRFGRSFKPHLRSAPEWQWHRADSLCRRASLEQRWTHGRRTTTKQRFMNSTIPRQH